MRYYLPLPHYLSPDSVPERVRRGRSHPTFQKHLSPDLIKLPLYNRAMDIFTALAEPTRRSIVEMLARSGPLSATEISEQFPVSPPAISQHLKVLREAKVVLMEKRAQQHMYRLNPDALFELEGWASHMTHLWNQRFDALDMVLEAEKKNVEKTDMERQKS